MLCDKFNLLELLDLSLRVPEVGAVNFNILHTVLTSLILELQLDHLHPLCFIQDEVAASAAVTKARLEDPLVKRRKSLRPTRDIKDIKAMLQAADLKNVGMEEILTPVVEDITKRVIEEKESKVRESMEEKESMTDVTSTEVKESMTDMTSMEGKESMTEMKSTEVKESMTDTTPVEEKESMTEKVDESTSEDSSDLF